MKNYIALLLLTTSMLFIGTKDGMAQDARPNAILLTADLSDNDGLGLGLGYERQIWRRSYISGSAYTNFNTVVDMNVAYKMRFVRLWRFSLLGGVRLNYTMGDLTNFGVENGANQRTVSWNPLLETRLRFTNKVDVVAAYNFKSRVLWEGSSNIVLPHDRGWNFGVRVKF